MLRKTLRGIAVGGFIAIAAPASAGPLDGSIAQQEAIFRSEAVLQGALSDIAGMREPELRAFARYLSECQIDNLTRHECLAARDAYEIEFGAKRSLDKLIYARHMLDDFERQRASHATGPVQLPTENQILQESYEDAHVITAMMHAAQDRFRAIRAGEK